MLDYHVILDLLPTLATLYFKRNLVAPKSELVTADGSPKEHAVRLSGVQGAMLLAMGLQRKTVEETSEELELEVNQVLAQFARIIKKICNVLQEIQRSEVVKQLPKRNVSEAIIAGNVLESMEEELEQAARLARMELKDSTAGVEDPAQERLREKQRELLNSLDLNK